ncbi:MAG: hypothetical protein LW717_23030, partial [Chloroflexaceae bacterium]|nr:hypothetical protein [Chloroflexaceae bacterium]
QADAIVGASFHGAPLMRRTAAHGHGIAPACIDSQADAIVGASFHGAPLMRRTAAHGHGIAPR